MNFALEDFIKIMISDLQIFCQLMALAVIITGAVKVMIIFFKDGFFGLSMKEVIDGVRTEIGLTFGISTAFLAAAQLVSFAVAPAWTTLGFMAGALALSLASMAFVSINYPRLDTRRRNHRSNNDQNRRHNRQPRPRT